MKWLKAIMSWIVMVVLGMMGGQGRIGGKSTRRFGLPSVAIFTAWKWDGFQWKDSVFLLSVPVLVLGYGENSHLMQLLGSDGLVRAVYACLLSIPFWFYGYVRGIVAIVLLVVAFQVRAGSLGSTAWFGDFLVEDIIRYGVFAGLVVFNIVFKRGEK